MASCWQWIPGGGPCSYERVGGELRHLHDRVSLGDARTTWEDVYGYNCCDVPASLSPVARAGRVRAALFDELQIVVFGVVS